MRRIAELDALRGLAAIGIVAYHYGDTSPLYDRFLYAGVAALELFFVLSGFLISSIILAHAGERGFLPSFYARRGLRIWPAYYLFILACAAIVVVRRGGGSIGALPYYLTFTQNIQYYGFADPLQLAFPATLTWSLAVEEQYYLVWPLLISLVGARRMAPLALALVATAIASRLAGFHPWILAARCDGFAIGGLLAVILARPRREGSRALTSRFLIVGAACAAYLMVGVPLLGGRPFDIMESPGRSVNITAAAAFFACAIGLVVRHEGHRALAPLRWRWLCGLGTISYGVYLYHNAARMLGDALVARLRLPAALSTAAVSPALCLAIACASWTWLEKPCLRLKDRFRYGRGDLDAPRPRRDTPPTSPRLLGGRMPG